MEHPSTTGAGLFSTFAKHSVCCALFKQEADVLYWSQELEQIRVGAPEVGGRVACRVAPASSGKGRVRRCVIVR